MPGYKKLTTNNISRHKHNIRQQKIWTHSEKASSFGLKKTNCNIKKLPVYV